MKNYRGRIRKCCIFAAMIIMLISLSACTSKDQEITMYVGLGNVGSYYEQIREAVEKETGIKINFVFSNTMDTTNAIANRIENGDLPADIIITGSKTGDKACEKSLMDIASYTNLCDKFNLTEVDSNTSESGAVYQLPFTSRLIGIEYNKTLLDEMGWELPRNYEEMKELKAKADAANVKFAVYCGAATGHGFNYLFHIMGTNYITSPDGLEWITKYRAGDCSVNAFADKISYFTDYYEAGLFGDVHDEDWQGGQEFSQQRALFYYNHINDVYKYDGYQYDSSGRILGASYDSDGKPVAKKSAKGEAVLIDGEYVFYDKNNEAHQGLDRYTIPGATILHDKYASMPWLSKEGATNCFTAYNCMYIGINKELGNSANDSRREAVIKVLNYMLSDEAMEIFNSIYPDGYVFAKNFKIDESRLYYEYADQITNGYTMEWYYNRFDVDSITNVGEKVNSYLKGNESMSAVLAELDKRNAAFLKGKAEGHTDFKTDFDYESSAKLQAIGNGVAAENALKKNGIDGEVELSILPYIESPSDINKTVYLPVVQERFYSGVLVDSKLSAQINSLTNDVSIVKMSGKEIKKLVDSGFNAPEDYKYDHSFKCVCVSKGGVEINTNKSYLVAIPEAVLGAENYKAALEAGNVICKASEPVKATMLDGLTDYLKDKNSISVEELVWK